MEKTQFLTASKVMVEQLIRLEAEVDEIDLDEQQKQELITLNEQLTIVSRELEKLKWKVGLEIDDNAVDDVYSC